MARLTCRFLAAFAGLSASVLVGCGGDSDGGTPPPTTVIAKASTESGDAQTGTVGQQLISPIRVLVTESGAPAPDVTVNWSTAAANASLLSSSVTDAEGIAINTWTLGTVAGPQTAQATLNGASGSPVTFTATAAPDDPVSLSKLSGDQQHAPINTDLAPVVAKVSDQHGNGVSGVAVAWSASGATVSAVSVPTDAAGASSVTVTLGGVEGPITITAEAADLSGSPQIFSATADPPGPVSADVTVLNDFFSPSTLTVSAGTTVVWTWGTGAVGHNVTPASAGSLPPGSGALASAPKTYQFTFNTPGTYNYYCQAHGTPASGMRGSIIVQ